MNRIEVLLTIRGDNFDALQFSDTLPPNLQGKVKELKNWHDKMPAHRKYFWTSPRLEIGTAENTHILAIVRDYAPYLQSVFRCKGVDIVCDIVTHFENASSVHGFWFPPEVISILSEYRMALNIDSYCYDREDEQGLGSGK